MKATYQKSIQNNRIRIFKNQLIDDKLYVFDLNVNVVGDVVNRVYDHFGEIFTILKRNYWVNQMLMGLQLAFMTDVGVDTTDKIHKMALHTVKMGTDRISRFLEVNFIYFISLNIFKMQAFDLNRSILVNISRTTKICGAYIDRPSPDQSIAEARSHFDRSIASLRSIDPMPR
ncbi:hypothetical protein YC2023_041678 [Brassica napus]